MGGNGRPIWSVTDAGDDRLFTTGNKCAGHLDQVGNHEVSLINVSRPVAALEDVSGIFQRLWTSDGSGTTAPKLYL
jgi:hypothetical protein